MYTNKYIDKFINKEEMSLKSNLADFWHSLSSCKKEVSLAICESDFGKNSRFIANEEDARFNTEISYKSGTDFAIKDIEQCLMRPDDYVCSMLIHDVYDSRLSYRLRDSKNPIKVAMEYNVDKYKFKQAMDIFSGLSAKKLDEIPITPRDIIAEYAKQTMKLFPDQASTVLQQYLNICHKSSIRKSNNEIQNNCEELTDYVKIKTLLRQENDKVNSDSVFDVSIGLLKVIRNLSAETIDQIKIDGGIDPIIQYATNLAQLRPERSEEIMQMYDDIYQKSYLRQNDIYIHPSSDFKYRVLYRHQLTAKQEEILNRWEACEHKAHESFYKNQEVTTENQETNKPKIQEIDSKTRETIQKNKERILKRRTEKDAAIKRYNENKNFYTFDNLEFIMSESDGEPKARIMFDNGWGIQVENDFYSGSDAYVACILDKSGKETIKTVLNTVSFDEDGIPRVRWYFSCDDINAVNKLMKDIQKLNKNGNLPPEYSEAENLSGVVVADEIAKRIIKENEYRERIMTEGLSSEECKKYSGGIGYEITTEVGKKLSDAIKRQHLMKKKQKD